MVCINELLFMCLLSLQTHFVHMSYPKAIARASRPRGVLEMQATTHSGQYDFWAWSMRAKSKTQLCKAYLVIHTPSSSVVPALLHVDDLHFRSESKLALSHGCVCVYVVVARTVRSSNTTIPLLACTCCVLLPSSFNKYIDRCAYQSNKCNTYFFVGRPMF